MPTKREREYYRMGFIDGQSAMTQGTAQPRDWVPLEERTPPRFDYSKAIYTGKVRKPKRKLSAWNKFVKANSKKPRFRLRSGSPNLKKLGVAFRKTPAGKKKRR